MQKLKEYKLIIIITALVLGFTFYWYEWRPTSIKKECAARAEVKEKWPIGDERFKDYEYFYKNCLREYGL